jgi:hypothetical protein
MAKGLLRRLRGEAEPDDLYAAAKRILADLELARRPIPVAVPEPQAPLAAVVASAPLLVEVEPEPERVAVPADGESGSWKRTAESKGRIKRRHEGGKGSKGHSKSHS